jgi:hypothetical protein
MGKYATYFYYILEHKWNVLIECFKMGMILHGITHDLSKFLPSEFISYARFFHAKDRTKTYKTSDEQDPNFLMGWCLHQKRNKHHWNYWVCVTRKDEISPIPMPMKYVKQMIADWRGMSRKFAGNARDYYLKNRDSIILHSDTTRIVEALLGVVFTKEEIEKLRRQ